MPVEIDKMHNSFPRIRGDVPQPRNLPQLAKQFSAYAGMFRYMAIPEVITASFPRIRGDVPSGSQVRSI